ncbi:hypothetical protein IPH25_02160 [bacterium]|nr:MAG: hypothetical protein IPG37_04290 [bacterium]QQR62227.1 MAG: hypothetical protein IPH25_02160 [bacterium]QQR63211.1 MAG: hypothetical protein IPH67_01920 [bacterium]
MKLTIKYLIFSSLLISSMQAMEIEEIVTPEKNGTEATLTPINAFFEEKPSTHPLDKIIDKLYQWNFHSIAQLVEDGNDCYIITAWNDQKKLIKNQSKGYQIDTIAKQVLINQFNNIFQQKPETASPHTLTKNPIMTWEETPSILSFLGIYDNSFFYSFETMLMPQNLSKKLYDRYFPLLINEAGTNSTVLVDTKKNTISAKQNQSHNTPAYTIQMMNIDGTHYTVSSSLFPSLLFTPTDERLGTLKYFFGRKHGHSFNNHRLIGITQNNQLVYTKLNKTRTTEQVYAKKIKSINDLASLENDAKKIREIQSAYPKKFQKINGFANIRRPFLVQFGKDNDKFAILKRYITTQNESYQITDSTDIIEQTASKNQVQNSKNIKYSYGAIKAPDNSLLYFTYGDQQNEIKLVNYLPGEETLYKAQNFVIKEKEDKEYQFAFSLTSKIENTNNYIIYVGFYEIDKLTDEILKNKKFEPTEPEQFVTQIYAMKNEENEHYTYYAQYPAQQQEQGKEEE